MVCRLAKFRSILWWVAKNDAVYVRATNLMTSKWLLEEIAEELGEMPYHTASILFKQITAKLIDEPKVIIIDEIDYLMGNSRVIETIRDLHDKTNVPIVLAGMGKSDKKLSRYKHIYDRLFQKIEFKSFDSEDVKDIIQELSEVKFTECALEYISSRVNRFRQIVKIISKLEQAAKTNGIEEFNHNILKEFILDERNIKKETTTQISQRVGQVQL